MFGLPSWLILGVGIAVAIVGALTTVHLTSYRNGYAAGRASAIAEIRSANDAATEAARRAREDLARECRADPARCLRDEFTRDRPD